MAKPILVIYYHPSIFDIGSQVFEIGDINKQMQEKFSDYHVIAIPSERSEDGSCENVRLEVLNAKDVTEFDLIDFKHSVLVAMKLIEK